MNRIIHFEIPADDPENVMEFFETVFGWQFSKHPEQDYWLTSTGEERKPGIEGAVFPRDTQFPSLVNVIQVEDIEAMMEKITQHGGKQYREKQAVPGLGWAAYFQDPSGIILGIWQSDENAK